MSETLFDAEQKREVLRRILQGRGSGGEASSPAPLSTRGEKTARLEEGADVAEWYARMAQLAGLGLKDPCFRSLEGPAAGTVSIGGRALLDFSGYNYLGLAADSRVKQAAKDAIDQYGTSASASRLASGERPLHRELESRLAHFLGVEDSIVFTAGYATNVSVLGHVLAPADLVIHDELAHNSIIMGCQLSRSRRFSFPHNDLRALDDLLVRHRGDSGKALIVVEGAYSMDGDYPDLPELIAVARRHSAALFVDEAHSIGVMGRSGRGIGEHFGVDRGDVDLDGDPQQIPVQRRRVCGGQQQAHPLSEIHGTRVHLQCGAAASQRSIGVGIPGSDRKRSVACGEAAGECTSVPRMRAGSRSSHGAIRRHRRGPGHRAQLGQMPAGGIGTL